jgi:DNA-binding GntR family transcriptional regulator
MQERVVKSSTYAPPTASYNEDIVIDKMKTPSRKVSPVSTSQKVENFIRSAIYEGRLKPRERLIEDDIARQLGCSRGPLREAVLRLERDGLVVITPRRGTFIRDIPPEDVEVLFSMRGKLEGLCVRYMREQMTPEKQHALEKALHAMKEASEAGDEERFLKCDLKLHRTIWKFSGKQQLYQALSVVMNPLFFMIARAYSTKLNAVDVAYASHVKYIQTILTVPISKVEREVEKYFSGIYRDLNKTVFHNPMPFGLMLDANERDELDDALGTSA